jgi:hypothetical protein
MVLIIIFYDENNINIGAKIYVYFNKIRGWGMRI